MENDGDAHLVCANVLPNPTTFKRELQEAYGCTYPGRNC